MNGVPTKKKNLVTLWQQKPLLFDSSSSCYGCSKRSNGRGTKAYVSVRVITLQDAYGKLDTVPEFIQLCTLMACNE